MATKKQAKKPGILSRIAGGIRRGVGRIFGR